jgi:hypothetical protein
MRRRPEENCVRSHATSPVGGSLAVRFRSSSARSRDSFARRAAGSGEVATADSSGDDPLTEGEGFEPSRGLDGP